MTTAASWAYDFACDRSLDELHAAFDKAGPWQWALRDSAWYGDYLNTRPAEGVRARIHAYPQTGAAGTFTGLRDRGFSALLQIDAGSPATRDAIDRIFRGLLARAAATEITPIQPYD